MMKKLLILLALVPSVALASSGTRSGPISADYVAILENRIQLLEEQLRNVTNQAEQASFQAKSAQDRLTRLEEDMNTRFRMLDSGTAPAVDGGASAMIPDSAPTRLNPDDTAQANPDTQRLGELSTSAAALPDDPNLAYDQAFQKIRSGDYEAAESALRAFVQKWPKSELASNASYWLGETFYVRGEYAPAAKAFAQGYQTYPKGAKAEDTLLKLGLTLGALKRNKDACMTFDQLTKEFPRLSSTNKRRVDLERTQLECSSAQATTRRTNTAR
jgi:tol-pal system protein YbgF